MENNKILGKISELMNAVKTVLQYRKVYKYTIITNIQFYNRKQGSFYPGEQQYCWGDEKKVSISVYSFNKIDKSKFNMLANKYSAMLLPGCEREITERFITENPSFFMMDIEENEESLYKEVYID